MPTIELPPDELLVEIAWLRAENERLRAVLDAARNARDCDFGQLDIALMTLGDALDAYDAAKGEDHE
jgi:hypothetical protein